MDRREFCGFTATAAAGLFAGGTLHAGRQAPSRRVVIDGLGEINLDYEPVLIDEIRASGMRGCVVTLGNPALQTPSDAYADMEKERQGHEERLKRMPDRLARALSVQDIDKAAERNAIALIYYLQNITQIGDDLAKLADLKTKGIRIIQLTYNMRNLVGDGCLERQNSGLSTFGVELVARMNEMGLLVDLSHCGEATTNDGIRTSKKPVAITHSACKALFDHPRNKNDETIKLLADRGGVMGIFQINPYIGAKERNTLDDFLRHIDHAVKVAGVEHVGVGSDREHRRIPDTPEEKQKLIDELSRLRPVNAASFRWPFFISELNHPRRMETIATGLEKRGYKADAIDKILGGNFYRLFKDTIG
jgi:membrane dipeptidase